MECFQDSDLIPMETRWISKEFSSRMENLCRTAERGLYKTSKIDQETERIFEHLKKSENKRVG